MPQPLLLPKLRQDYPKNYTLLACNTPSYANNWQGVFMQKELATVTAPDQTAAAAALRDLFPSYPLDETGYWKAPDGVSYITAQVHEAAASRQQWH